MIDYELIDSGAGRKLERFGKYLLDRPDPEVLWDKKLSESEWKKADAFFNRRWNLKSKMPQKWRVKVEDLEFWLKLTPFKHTGIFPEQLWEWQYIAKKVTGKGQVNFLNLFAYTGAASLFAAKAGARVTHVDSSRPAVTWANENRELNKMGKYPIRWIVDDALKFTQREVNRGVKYDAIIMDPPVYGHSPEGKPWDFGKDLPKLLTNCQKLLSNKPLFVLINAYAVSISVTTLQNTLRGYFRNANLEGGELTLKEKSGGRLLSTGIWTKCEW